jgi:hypothetical protein
MNRAALKKFVDGVWTREIVPEITEYIRIPNEVAVTSIRTGRRTASSSRRSRTDDRLGEARQDGGDRGRDHGGGAAAGAHAS